MFNLSPPKFFTDLFPGLTWRYPEGGKKVYITFDDGPTMTITPWVLDKLKKHNAKATFFCLGKKVEMHPEIFERIKAEGHAVGNHSYSHVKGWENGTGQYMQDVDMANDIIGSTLFRPPYGRIKPSQVRIINKRYKIIMWSLLSMDYSRWITPKRCAKIITNNLRDGSIIVFHDSKKAEKNMKYALVKLIEEVKRRGWEFGVVS